MLFTALIFVLPAGTLIPKKYKLDVSINKIDRNASGQMLSVLTTLRSLAYEGSARPLNSDFPVQRNFLLGM